MLPVWGQKICWATSQFIMLVCCVYIVYGTYLQHDIIRGNASPVAQISMLWVFGVSYVSGTAIGLICLSNLVRLAMGRVEDSELCDVIEEGMADAEEIANEMTQQTAAAGATK
jgi:TRAP-type C4-dicarboxylate transport system permease small subunit